MTSSQDGREKREERTVSELFDMTGQLALVTGAADPEGYGHQIATALAEAGARVIITSRDEGTAKAAAKSLRSEGDKRRSRQAQSRG